MIRPQIRPKRERDEQYLVWIRKQPCLTSPRCSGLIEAHHVREEGNGGIGTKPPDMRAVPLCVSMHRVYHNQGRIAFERKFELDLEAEILRLQKEYQSQQHPSPRARKVSVKVKEVRVSCDCHLKLHPVTPKKFYIKDDVLHFWCIGAKTWKEARIA